MGIPFLSAFLFVMGGILIGHLLWYRDRRADQSVVHSAESKYAKARATARARKYHFRCLQAEMTALQKQHERLRSEHERLRREHEQLAGELQEQSRVAQQHQQTDRQEIQKLHGLLCDAETRYEQAAGQMQELAQAAEIAGDDIVRHQVLSEQLQADLQELRGYLSELTEQRNAALAQRDQFAAERAVQQNEYETLHHQLRQCDLQVQTLQAEHDELLDQLDGRTARVQEAIDGRVTAEMALAEVENQFEALQAELDVVTEQRDIHQASLTEIHASSELLRREAEQLAATLTQKNQTLQELEAAIQDRDQSLTTLQATREQSETQLAEQDALVVQLRQEHAAMRSRVGQLETQLRDNAAAMRDLRRKRAHVPVLEPSREQRRAA